MPIALLHVKNTIFTPPSRKSRVEKKATFLMTRDQSLPGPSPRWNSSLIKKALGTRLTNARFGQKCRNEVNFRAENLV